MSLYEFGEHLRDVFPLDRSGWPLTCKGSPFDCPVFLVGLDPERNIPFRDFWEPSCG